MNEPWIDFAQRLPSMADATTKGCVEAREVDGSTRIVLWAWTNTADSWRVNGFVAWRHLARYDPSEAGERSDGQSLTSQRQ